MSIAPAGSSSNSVHKKIRTSRSPSALGGIGGREGGWGVGVMEPELSDSVSLSLSFSFSHSLTTYLSLSSPKCFFFLFNFSIICLIEPKHSDLPECLTHFAWHVVEREPGQNNLSLKASVTSPRCGIPISQIQGYCSRWFHCCVANLTALLMGEGADYEEGQCQF